MSLKERIDQVEARISKACEASGRSREDINLVAVTKYVSAAETAAVLQAGLTHIGENRVSVAVPKWEALNGQGIWHFIGSLQSKKVKDVIGKFAYIHSLDRMSLAQELEKRAGAAGQVVKAFIQINISGEQSKQGLTPEEAPAFLKDTASLQHLDIVGLMTMAPFEAEPEHTRPVFRGLRELRDELNRMAITRQPMTELSMGMSNDFEVAIEEGATWLRLGSLLVGKGEVS
ncbi:YggS family pyridoxal phosphate-dependent enzyme [Paenibacillus sp. CAA11]|uniref:YggS family pyridoxal phosphate-dependent enzyme n=1 Tax=Paenibacillus sp. CAA11 TaxID=1532905 RepID=UPI000D387928|nr:YggS family pyridoxal phosphate-dependent enzyme [Paenibacillus sp. CAA11]AWB45354.1 YggS family pyridoxal phosphate-dependent enzyme [Paenibacillus sp. CAA11]